MTQPTRREAQAQERRRQLIDTALTLFATKGFESTTIKDIAQAADVAQGLIYHYFRSKDDLFYAIIGAYNPLPQLAEVLVGAGERPAAEVLLAVVTRAYALVTERREVLQLIVREMLTRPDFQQAFKVLQSVGVGLMTQYLDARIAAGELRPHDSQVTARMVVGAVVAFVVTDFPAAALPDVIDTLLNGLLLR